MDNVQYDRLTQIQRTALDAAFEAKEKAYCPYSGFHVGAALYSASGTDVVTGANVENAAYIPTLCAERSAIVRANAMGLRRFDGIAVVARGKDF
jgi:cytidine deaminase